MQWLIQFINNYIHTRMDGLYGFRNISLEYTEPTTLGMPKYLENAIGKYGEELHGVIDQTGIYEIGAMETLRKYVNDLHIPDSKTYHAYESELPFSAGHAIHLLKYSNPCLHIIDSYPNHYIQSIHSMNEVYVSSIGGEGSDRVFETPHIDGLFAWLPWCRVFRCIIAIQGNKAVDTIFPLSANRYTLETGEYIVFDYNRAIHYIEGNPAIPDDRTRMILKLHYIVYPEWFPWAIAQLYIGIHGRYNAFLRGLFVHSQIEEGSRDVPKPQIWISSMINGGTTFYAKVFLIALFLYKTIWQNYRKKST